MKTEYILIMWLVVITITLIVVFVDHVHITNRIIKRYQEELKTEYNKGYEKGLVESGGKFNEVFPSVNKKCEIVPVVAELTLPENIEINQEEALYLISNHLIKEIKPYVDTHLEKDIYSNGFIVRGEIKVLKEVK